jgi:hypothetical protein
MPRRERRDRALPGQLHPRRQILVVCGGRRTEPAYLDGLRRTTENAALQIRAVGRSPVQLVDYASGLASTRDYDEVWCVVDADQFDVEQAHRSARVGDVELAVSSPCFEYWLLLHLRDVRRQFRDCREVTEELLRHLPAYDKTGLRFGDFADGIADAVTRARTLHDGTTAPYPNPSSGIWRLVERLIAKESP